MNCHQCEGATATEECFKVLSLPIPSREEVGEMLREAKDAVLSIHILLDHFFRDADVERRCEQCKAVMGTSSERLCQLPHLLLMHIKRFDAHRDEEGGNIWIDRRDDSVAIPHELSLDKHCTEDAELPPDMATSFDPDTGESRGRGRRPLAAAASADSGAHHDERHRYRLKSTVLHFGRRVNSGHYKCVYRSDDGTWWCANDDHITQAAGTTAEEVLSQRDVLENGYVVCYEYCGYKE
eukprot:TRINITY_DN11172_c0_g1_i1.p1 TRINITY_DN11172_c0_g1~~TRINITY_DN11172_c0_g1_i1.p1  ORF type:complete len:238 (+),score=70.24 TRINITY_DN11172_c0_g1_i1:652-1365(+)